MKHIVSLLCLLALLLSNARSAVVADVTDSEFVTLTSTGVVAWSVKYQTGYPSLSQPEIFISANGVMTLNHTWSNPEQMGVSYDEAGNLNVRAGSTTQSVQPLLPFNTILVRLADKTFFSTVTEFKDVSFDGTPVRNLFADDANSFVTDYDILRIDGVNGTFVLGGSFYRSMASVEDQSRLEIYGVNLVPEPSTSLLVLIAGVALVLRRSKPTGSSGGFFY